MDLTRREFIGSVSAAAAVTGLRPEMTVTTDDDPLGVRSDFPVVQEAIYLDSALDYRLRVGVSNIERHTVDLAHRLQEGLMAQGFDVWTPARNRSAIVTFEHGRDIEMVRRTLGDAGIRISFKQGSVKLRAGVALFNVAEDIGRLLEGRDGGCNESKLPSRR